MPNNNTELQIGPLRYTYAVQKIQTQDKKSVKLLDTARSNRNFIIDSGDSAYRAQIRLLFTGLDEINRGIGDDQQDSGLRGLVALFRCCPIITIKNDTLGAAWKRQDELYEDDFVSVSSKSKFFTDIIPVAIDQIELENVPDVPNSIQVTLSVSRIDVSPVSQDETLLYLGERGPADKQEHPKDSFWLKKWITKILADDSVPELRPSDFDYSKLTWYGKDSIGREINREAFKEEVYIHLNTTDKEANTIGVSENCSMRHKFAYNTLQGSNFPYAVHMGSTSRLLSMDLVFNNQKTDADYKKFCRFKETSDELIKSKNRFDRVTGWNIKSPISKLMSVARTIGNSPDDRPYDGIYVPVSINSETSDTPNMINTRIDMLENNVDFFTDNEVQLIEGGTDYDELKKYFDNVLNEEVKFRSLLVSDREQALKELVGEGDNSNFASYKLFWPLEKGITNIKEQSSFGIFNIDTLRAVFLSPALDKSQKLLRTLQETSLATGRVIANRRITVTDKLTSLGGFAWKLVAGLDVDSPEISPVYQEVRELVANRFVVFDDSLSSDEEEALGLDPDRTEKLINSMAHQITIGLLGDGEGAFVFSKSLTGELLGGLAKSNLRFSDEFKEALFKVVVERKAKPINLPHVYSTDGIYAAFYKLITKYTLEKGNNINIDDARKELINKRNRNSRAQTLYPDLLLPTYSELYGPDRWKEFAPTVEDLGIDTYNDTDQPRENVLAVQQDDLVSPAAWFFIKRAKSGPQGLRSLAKEAAKAVNELSPRMSISMPFNTDDVEEIKQKIQESNETGPDTGTSGFRTNRTVSEIIKESLTEYRERDPKNYRKDVTNILSNSERFEEKFLGDKGSIKVYLHHNGNRMLRKELNIPGLGAEIYRVITEDKKLKVDNLPRIDADAQYTTAFDKDVKWHRHMNENTRKILDSSLDQVPDDQYSPERLFPAVKVYLVDKRGNDIIADDSLFNVNAIVSIDITKDKEDADLAVIKIADPLFTLQNDYFTERNIVDDGADKLVLNTLKEEEGVLKRYKIIQGRSIQIRMGYGSMAYNLPIVFTGRITEIVPGDQLTLVAQGWKAELINRKVNFYNDDPKNWGARDLAVQSITYASPEGFGDYFPEFDAQYILRNLDAQNISDMIDQSASNGQNVDLDTVGSRGVGQGISNWARRYIGMRSNDKENLGFDTRLKNIWYPDTALYNNVFGVSTKAGLMPSWQNDSWIVPLQSSWDALKEASRHAWNCIVDVVPYDSQATIFMGHPDQPYFFTRGNSLSRAYYNREKNKQDQDYAKTMTSLIDGFLSSRFFTPAYDVSLVAADLERINNLYTQQNSILGTFSGKSRDVGAAVAKIMDRLDITSFSSLVNFHKVSKAFAGNRPAEQLFAKIRASGVPVAMLEQMKDQGFYDSASAVLFSSFFGIDLDFLRIRWPNLDSDITRILARQTDYEQFKPDIENKLDTLPTRSSFKTNLLTKLNSSIGRMKSFGSVFTPSRTATSRPNQYRIVVLSELFELALKDKTVKEDPSLRSYVQSQLDSALELEKDRQRSVSRAGEVRGGDPRLDRVDFVLPILEAFQTQLNTRNEDSVFNPKRSILTKLGVPLRKNLKDIVIDNFHLFKAFVYFFSVYALQDDEASTTIKSASATDAKPLPPNMKVFRSHHYADSDHNIIKNSIVATTREMWNTVVIEHPEPGSAESVVPSKGALYTEGRINAGANWVYYPKQEVTGVVGLQFHPGLTLSNKKVKVFTELNCQTSDLAAKLACEHLASGIRKMYRGNLLMIGKHMKPHDRIILADKYLKMTGPVEVESVVHHWNAEQGWITNIVPNAVCDSNPGAGILQTAALEATYQGVYNTLEFLSDALTIAAVVATAGAAAPLAVGKFGLKRAAATLGKRFIEGGIKGGLTRTLKAQAVGAKYLGKSLKGNLKSIFKQGQTMNALRTLMVNYTGPAVSVLKNQLYIGAAQWGTHMSFKMNAIAGFVESSTDVEQLPVIASPLIYNGNPFTAGMETEDSIWAISAFGLFYSAREMQKNAQRLLEDIIGE